MVVGFSVLANTKQTALTMSTESKIVTALSPPHERVCDHRMGCD